MDKTSPKNPKKGNKELKTKTKKHLKVVYISNPIKFTTTASKFQALVQELIGQDADVSDSLRLAAALGGAVGGGLAPGDNVHAVVEEQVGGKIGQTVLLQNGSDLSTFGSYEEIDDDDVFYSQEMMDGLAYWHQEYSNLDVFKRLDATM